MAYLGSLHCLCVKTGSASIQAVGTLTGPRIKVSPAKLRASIIAEGVVLADATRLRTSPASLSTVASISSKLSASVTMSVSLMSAEPSLSARSTCEYGLSKSVQAEATFSAVAEKVAGDFANFTGDQKLYPILDLNIESGFRGFVNKLNVSGSLYQSIDDGVFVGDYAHNLSRGYRIADDKTSYIQPSSIVTEDVFQYKCQITTPIVRPEDSRFVMRASAPLYNYESRTPPKYTIYDIQFKDPSGNLVTEYEDIVVRGDADHGDASYRNFAVYSSKPQTNNAALDSWHTNYPLMNESSGYTLSFNVLSESMDDAFDDGFTSGFQEVSTIYDSGGYASLTAPTHGLKISAIEICSSGGYGPRLDSHLNIYAQVRESGNRIERRIYPQILPISSFDDGIYPSVTSVWWANNQPTLNNTTTSGSRVLIDALNNPSVGDYITLKSATSTSGKLIAKFGHTSNGNFMDVSDGAFGNGFDQSLYGMWLDPTGAFNTQNKTDSDAEDGFFVVESVSLKVLAKKASGSNNYVLDVVGYSDDKLLNVTSAVGGFLQNVSGIGTYPTSSGFANNDDLALDGTSISERDWYYRTSGNNAGGDHYSLSQLPVISGIDFQWYEIPLKVYDDRVTLGKSREYNMSSMFENLYLDLYPIPSGASIAGMYMLVRYKPQNALGLITEGGEDIGRASYDRTEAKIYPSSRQSNDEMINAGSGYAPLSTISGIPHAYTTPSTLKSNYSRRWRGMEGTTNGPFDPDMFGFGFSNPMLDFPFLSGFYDFSDDVGKTIVPRVGTLSGYLTTSASNYRFKNVGWRFTSGNLFSSQLPGYSGAYQTTDWTSLSSGVSNFTAHPLYGQIADAFDSVVRVSSGAYINFGNAQMSGGFSLYLRFSPDSTVSGVNKDLFQSGVLVSKWAAGSGMEFLLGYSGGYLQALANTSSGTIQSVRDTALYDTYQYPLGVILTYNDHDSSGLKLYTDNEFESNWTTLRASSIFPFAISGGSGNLVLGHSSGSGVGFDMFVSEIGISNSANIVYSGADATNKEVTAQTFLQNNRVRWWDANETSSTDSYTLWDNLNEDTLVDWTIGDFKYFSFSPAFSQLSKRTGRDLVNFRLKHDGSGYSRRANIALPSTIDSSVSYHTQIENDFLRFNLSDTPDNFYSVARRITKDLPRGYKFNERALVVETILEHQTRHNIAWNDGNIGPKLIVSLYTRRQEPYWTPDEDNWGLINRSIHYIEPSSCIMRLDSVFDYDSLTDTTESWALFPSEPRIRDFKERYFSNDVDDMFLQYDLVYPSGEAFDSRIDIHSAHVRAENALVTPVDVSGNVNLLSQGAYITDEPLNLMLEARTFSSGTFNLYTIGPILIEESGLPIYTSGMLIAPGTLKLFTEGYRQVSPSGANPSSGITLYTVGQVFNASGDSEILKLSAFGLGIITSSGNGHLGIALTAYNDEAGIPGANTINMLTVGSTGVTSIYTSMPIFLANDMEIDVGEASGSIYLSTIGSTALFNRYPNGSLNLYTFNNTPSSRMNLIAYADAEAVNTSGSMNLYTSSYGSGSDGAIYIRWFNDNYGQEIDLTDNSWASVAVSDEIRGVDLIGYGSCTGDSPSKAIDSAVVTHDTVWREETCNDGGVFRAIRTYTNSDAGYSGNYYGIRKYENLIPNVAYNLELKVTTGSTEAIRTPREWEEWEYGTNDTINYSGAKLVSDYDSAEVSGRITGDEYGKKVVVRGDLLAVGSPFHTIPDDSGYAIPRAGAVYLYRRNEDVAGEKAAWELETTLSLPSGYKRDYVAEYRGGICYGDFCVSGRQWGIGQEGREFGSSIDIAVSGDSEIVVVGAPGAAWSRLFGDITVSGIPICMMVFTDKFTYNVGELYSVKEVADKWDILYKYFSAPWNAGGNEFQPKIDTKLIICQIADTETARPPVSIKEDWAFHTYIDRLDDYTLHNEYLKTRDGMFSGIKNVFSQAFPNPSNAVHSGLPPILGVFEDISISTSNGEATSDAVDLFVQYYKNLTRVSGVKDQITNLADEGYVNRVQGVAEEWVTDSRDLINQTLDTGNLSINDALKFITSGIGQQWARDNAYDFQYAPPSGGRVFVFQKESGVFNLIQSIAPPTEYALDYNDRFGHSVSISQNLEVMAIGSPFSFEPAQIYERDWSEDDRMYSGLKGWLHRMSMTAESGRILDLTNASGADFANRTVYNELSASNKYTFRTDPSYWDEPITPYKKVYTYSFATTGTWAFIPGEFAGTTRLGYSSSVSDDGEIVAFGAPTDSFNEFDDTNVWYQSGDTWASCINAGAVRLFESRKYYPHNKAVEFYRFGNLDMNSHPASSLYYNQMSGVFSPMGISYERLPFSTIEIPQEAGLAFIITPEIDAASTEIINNIKDWLALGDRTLVLVGNDPIYEENGKYKRSNDYINKILVGLGSRMRIVPARSREEALLDYAPVSSGRYNVIPSYVPRYSHGTYTNPQNMYAMGVGDIKIDLSSLDREDYVNASPCDAINYRCNLPLKHLGDLRAEWTNECLKTDGNGNEMIVKYQENWPFHFSNDNPAQDCDDYPDSPSPLFNRPNEEPVPILAAAEWFNSRSYTVPASSGSYIREVRTTVTETIDAYSTITEYADVQDNWLSFSIYENDTGVTGSNYIYDMGSFVNPTGVFERNAFAQGEPVSVEFEPIVTSSVYSENSILASEETYASSTSKVVIVASMFPENKESLSSDNNDENILFYQNLAGDKTVQVAGFTGRTRFTDAYSRSRLSYWLRQSPKNYDSVDENFDLTVRDLDSSISTVWVANPTGQPTSTELNKITSWMLTGDKRLVITYDGTSESAHNVTYLCEQLGLTNKPIFSASENRFLVQGFNFYERDITQSANADKLDIIGSADFELLANSHTYNTGTYNYIPIDGSLDDAVVYYNAPVYEYSSETPISWKFEDYATVKFDVSPGSGYRLFYKCVSETPNEVYSIDSTIRATPGGHFIFGFKEIERTAINTPTETYIDFTVPVGISRVTVELDTRRYNNISSSITNPLTVRLLSISGCPLAINESVVYSPTTREVEQISYETVEWYNPESTVTIPAYAGAIRTETSKYCASDCSFDGNQLVEDGPIVAAEEYENFSSFRSGSVRSKIVLLTDSTMIQGLYPEYRDGTGNEVFIRSLYPGQPLVDLSIVDNANENVYGDNARQFRFVQKIVAPERGSPGKYFAASGYSQLVSLFGGTGVVGNFSAFTDQENSYDPDDVVRAADPRTSELIKEEVDNFGAIAAVSQYPRYSGVINGKLYLDAGMGGGVPDLLRDCGKDYLDLDAFPSSGFRGDLFGYSVSLHNNKLLVGAPFNGFAGENVVTWSGIQVSGAGSGMIISGNGGAGAAFYYERTGSGTNATAEYLPWEFKQKIKPSSINVGIQNCTVARLTQFKGNHNLVGGGTFLSTYGAVTDQFGYSVSIAADMMAIGAPCHDFENVHDHIYSGSAAFIRKEFGSEFDIPLHRFYDLGSSGVRVDDFGNASGQMVLNNGAVFTYLNRMVDWNTRTQRWEYAEKIVAQGYNSRDQRNVATLTSGNENDVFGRSVSLNRARRGDGDYSLAIGSPKHQFALSSGYPIQPASGAGAAYVYDAMLREQLPAIPSTQSNIAVSVFGHKNPDFSRRLNLVVTQPVSGEPITYSATGIVFANESGVIYVEASGFDPSSKGFIAHRPYIESVIGSIADATGVNAYMSLITSGKPVENSGAMNLVILGDDSATVYNTVNLYTNAWNTINVGSGNTPLSVLTEGADPTGSSGIVYMYTSGIGTLNNAGSPLNLRVRGK